jgi:hypothetical protein
MNFLISAIIFTVCCSVSHGAIVSVSSNWHLQTWASQNSIQTSEVAKIGTINWASGSATTVRTSEAIFTFSLAGFNAQDISSASISVYGSTSFGRALQTRIDLYGLSNFSGTPTATNSLFVSPSSGEQLLLPDAFSAGTAYPQTWYSLTDSDITAFIVTELLNGRDSVSFRLSPSAITTPNSATSSLVIYQDLFNPNHPTLTELAPKLTITAYSAERQPELKVVFIQPPSDNQPPRFTGTLVNGPPMGGARLQASLDLGTSDPWADVASITLDAEGSFTFSSIPDSRPQALGARSIFFRAVTGPPPNP